MRYFLTCLNCDRETSREEIKAEGETQTEKDKVREEERVGVKTAC